MKITAFLLLLLSSVDAFGVAPVSKTTPNSGSQLYALQQDANSNGVSSQDPSSTPSRRSLLSTAVKGGLAAVTASLLVPAQPALARLEAVNKPELLPAEKNLNVIQTQKFLTSGQAKRLDGLLTNLERDTGFRVRVLCQAYPNTPGLAIRDYWDLGKEVRTIF